MSTFDSLPDTPLKVALAFWAPGAREELAQTWRKADGPTRIKVLYLLENEVPRLRREGIRKTLEQIPTTEDLQSWLGEPPSDDKARAKEEMVIHARGCWMCRFVFELTAHDSPSPWLLCEEGKVKFAAWIDGPGQGHVPEAVQ